MLERKFFKDDEPIRELLNKRIENIEFEIDLRVESLVAEIHKHGDEFRNELKRLKFDLEKLIIHS